MKKNKEFPKTDIIRNAVVMMPAGRPREAFSIYSWLCNDGYGTIPKDTRGKSCIAITLDDVIQLLPLVIEAEKG